MVIVPPSLLIMLLWFIKVLCMGVFVWLAKMPLGVFYFLVIISLLNQQRTVSYHGVKLDIGVHGAE